MAETAASAAKQRTVRVFRMLHPSRKQRIMVVTAPRYGNEVFYEKWCYQPYALESTVRLSQEIFSPMHAMPARYILRQPAFSGMGTFTPLRFRDSVDMGISRREFFHRERPLRTSYLAMLMLPVRVRDKWHPWVPGKLRRVVGEKYLIHPTGADASFVFILPEAQGITAEKALVSLGFYISEDIQVECGEEEKIAYVEGWCDWMNAIVATYVWALLLLFIGNEVRRVQAAYSAHLESEESMATIKAAIAVDDPVEQLHSAFHQIALGTETAHKALAPIIEAVGETRLHRQHPANITTGNTVGKALRDGICMLPIVAPMQTLTCIQLLLNIEFLDATSRMQVFSRVLFQILTNISISPRLQQSAAKLWDRVIAMDVAPSVRVAVVLTVFDRMVELLQKPCTRTIYIAASFVLDAAAVHSALEHRHTSCAHVIRAIWCGFVHPDHIARHAAVHVAARALSALGPIPEWRVLIVKMSLRRAPRVHLAAINALQALVRAGHLLCRQTSEFIARLAREPPAAGISEFDIQLASFSTALKTFSFMRSQHFLDFTEATGHSTVDLFAHIAAQPLGDDVRAAFFAAMCALVTSSPPFLTELFVLLIRTVSESRRHSVAIGPEVGSVCASQIGLLPPYAVRPHLQILIDVLFATSFTSTNLVGAAVGVRTLLAHFSEIRHSVTRRFLVALVPLFRARPYSALRALNTVQPISVAIIEFGTKYVLPLLQHSSPRVRAEALRACAWIAFSRCISRGPGGKTTCVLTSNFVVHASTEHITDVCRVQNRMIEVALTDRDASIRLLSLKLLAKRFCSTLTQFDTTRTLYATLHDNDAIGDAALVLFFRLARSDANSVTPLLWKFVVHCTDVVATYSVSPTAHEGVVRRALTALTNIAAECGTVLAVVAAALVETVMALTDNGKGSLVFAALSCVAALLLHVADADLPQIVPVRDKCLMLLHSRERPCRHGALRVLTSYTQAVGATDLYGTDETLLPYLLSMLAGGLKEPWSVRQDVVRLIGAIGATNPSRVHAIEHHRLMTTYLKRMHILPNIISADRVAFALASRLSSSLDDDELSLATRCALASALVVILVTTSTTTSDSRRTAIEHTLPWHTVASLAKRAVPACLDRIQRPDSDIVTRRSFLCSFRWLVMLLRNDARAFVDRAADMVAQFLRDDTSFVDELLPEIVDLIVELRHALYEEFMPLAPRFIVLLLGCGGDPAHVMRGLLHVGMTPSKHLLFVLPYLLDVMSDVGLTLEVRVQAVVTTDFLLRRQAVMLEHTARVVTTLHTILSDSPPRELGVATSMLLSTVELRGGPILEPRRGTFAKLRWSTTGYRCEDYLPPLAAPPVAPPVEDYSALWDTLQRVHVLQAHESVDWLSELCSVLQRSAPYPSLRCCHNVSGVFQPIWQFIFRESFLARYRFCDAAQRQAMADHIALVLARPDMSVEVLHELLNLAEFMEAKSAEHCAVNATQADACVFDIDALVSTCERCNLFAKALHYAEIQFISHTGPYLTQLHTGASRRQLKRGAAWWNRLIAVSERVISLSNRLGHRQSAHAVLHFLRTHCRYLTGDPRCFRVGNIDMYAKLRWWAESYNEHEKRYAATGATENLVGMLTALDAEGDANSVLELWSRQCTTGAPHSVLRAIAPLGAHAAWLLQNWSELNRCTSFLQLSSVESSFYHAMLAFMRNEPREALRFVAACRSSLDERIGKLAFESYDRAYASIVSLQLLTELEEAVCLGKSAALEPQRLAQRWRLRLEAMEPFTTTLYGSLSNYALLSGVPDNTPQWLEFVRLCRRENRARLGRSVLDRLLAVHGSSWHTFIREPHPRIPADIATSAGKLIYSHASPDAAISLLQRYIAAHRTASDAESAVAPPGSSLLCLGVWLAQELEAIALGQPEKQAEALRYLREAVDAQPTDVPTWRAWARLNFAAAQRVTDPAALDGFLTAACNGFLRCVELDAQRQDILGVMSLWFSTDPVRKAWVRAELAAFAPEQSDNSSITVVRGNLSRIPVDVWTSVTPQLVARLDAPMPEIRRAVRKIIGYAAVHHPQAFLYALHVSMNHRHSMHDIQFFGTSAVTAVARRVSVVEKLLMQLRNVSPTHASLVDEVGIVSHGLIHCAALRPERWRHLIESLWRQWEDTEGDISAARVVIFQLRAMLSEVVETAPDAACLEEYGSDLTEAVAAMESFVTHGDEWLALKCWRILEDVIAHMRADLRHFTSLDLAYSSPRLARLTPRHAIIPGQFRTSGGALPLIASVERLLRVIQSQRRPRCVRMRGTDGCDYKFLLKGHEDMRLDERVMQLLELVSSLLSADPSAPGRDACPVTYSVTPLSYNVGLVGWVENTDTLESLIVSRRHAVGVAADLEDALIASDIVAGRPLEHQKRLAAIQQLEAFDYVLQHTSADDLARAMWSLSGGAEQWLRQRTTYVRTLAAMSMVGYVLGLGDRHPNNIMLNRITGQVVHVDFGDCFEVSQMRQSFPERVPFRLTRMLVAAMEPCGISGNFRATCDSVMHTLREGRDNVMALLETFVDDPLISWRGGDRSVLHRLDEATGSLHCATLVRAMPNTLAEETLATTAAEAEMARRVVLRAREKLEGREDTRIRADVSDPLRVVTRRVPTSVTQQVDRIIVHAIRSENLAQSWIGWRAVW